LFQKRSVLPPRRKFLPSGEGGEKKLFLIIVNVLGPPKGVGGLTSYFLCGGGMDVFWNDPFRHFWSTATGKHVKNQEKTPKTVKKNLKNRGFIYK
jgi:hypothetical protein